MMKRTRRIGALLLSAALLLTQLPEVAMAERATPQDKGIIASFEPLDRSVERQTVTPGTELDALNLPDTVKASVCRVTEDTEISGGNGAGEGGGLTSPPPHPATRIQRQPSPQPQ